MEAMLTERLHIRLLKQRSASGMLRAMRHLFDIQQHIHTDSCLFYSTTTTKVLDNLQKSAKKFVKSLFPSKNFFFAKSVI